jgi:hypothetical protein
MAMSTIEHTDSVNDRQENTNSNKDINKHLTNQQEMTGEFLEKAEDIAMSTTSVEVHCDDQNDNDGASFESEQQHEGGSPYCPIAVDEATVREIIANDERLRREVDEFLEMYPMTIDDENDDDDSTFDYAAIMGMIE